MFGRMRQEAYRLLNKWLPKKHEESLPKEIQRLEKVQYRLTELIELSESGTESQRRNAPIMLGKLIQGYLNEYNLFWLAELSRNIVELATEVELHLQSELFRKRNELHERGGGG